MLIDTDIERSIKIGTNYTYDPMTEGQCFINSKLAKQMNMTEGDILHQKMDMYQNLVAIIKNYNKDVAIPQKLKKIKIDDATI